MFMPVIFNRQLLPGTFEQMLDELVGTRIDLSAFDKNYNNDHTGAPAVPPEALLKLIIFAYFKGCISSRSIQELNDYNIIAKALTGDMYIHFTTIAHFISSNGECIKDVFAQVLMYSNELKLISGEDFSVDGLRLPSNASIEMSGTEDELKKRLATCQKMSETHVERHKRKDAQGAVDENTQALFEKRQKSLRQKADKMAAFLGSMEKKIGSDGNEIKSNVTDNDSATIKSGGGFIQGYIGIAVTDAKSQVIVCAKAVGSANEGEHLPGLLEQTLETLENAGIVVEEDKGITLLADSNYHSEDNLVACKERGVEAIIPDGRDKLRTGPDGEKRYDVEDFKYNEEDDSYECPQGKVLEYKGSKKHDGVESKEYRAKEGDCKACPDYTKCSRSRKGENERRPCKTLSISKSSEPGSQCRQMRAKLGTVEYQDKYARRIQISEPVNANIKYCKGLNRFTLRSKGKVNGQWLLFCLVHNLGKCLNGRNAEELSA
jgi:transposase